MSAAPRPWSQCSVSPNPAPPLCQEAKHLRKAILRALRGVGPPPGGRASPLGGPRHGPTAAPSPRSLSLLVAAPGGRDHRGCRSGCLGGMFHALWLGRETWKGQVSKGPGRWLSGQRLCVCTDSGTAPWCPTGSLSAQPRRASVAKSDPWPQHANIQHVKQDRICYCVLMIPPWLGKMPPSRRRPRPRVQPSRRCSRAEAEGQPCLGEEQEWPKRSQGVSPTPPGVGGVQESVLWRDPQGGRRKRDTRSGHTSPR